MSSVERAEWQPPGDVPPSSSPPEFPPAGPEEPQPGPVEVPPQVPEVAELPPFEARSIDPRSRSRRVDGH
jgi:hypothetical protein